MTARIRLAAGVVLAVTAVACTAAGRTVLPARADIAELRLQVERTERAFARTMVDRDHAAFSRFIAPDAIFFTGDTPLRGRDTIVAAWRRFFDAQQAPFTWEPDHVEVLESGALALSTGPVHDAGGTAVMRFNSIWRREPSGDWLIVFDRGSPAGSPRVDTTTPAMNDDGTMASRCRSAVYREFDFWIGSWTVRNAAGNVIGRSRVQRAARGCAIVENWRGAGGGMGVSVNGYDDVLGRWTQRWVGEGATLWLEGELEGESMVLRGQAPRATPQGPVHDRISWTPLPDGRVRQLWEISSNGGVTWREAFEGFYSREPSGQ